MRQDPRAMLAAMALDPELVDPAVRAWWVDAARRTGHDPRMGFKDHGFQVKLEHVPGSTEGSYTLAGITRGPFTNPDDLERQLLHVLVGWDQRAKALGGWCYRPHALQVVVVLPEDVPVDGSGPVLPWYELGKPG